MWQEGREGEDPRIQNAEFASDEDHDDGRVMISLSQALRAVRLQEEVTKVAEFSASRLHIFETLKAAQFDSVSRRTKLNQGAHA